MHKLFLINILKLALWCLMTTCSALPNILKRTVFFVIDDNSLLLALEDLIVLLKLFIALHHLLICHLATNIAANLGFLFQCIELHLNTLFRAAFIL